jgi:hypothetical protein
VKVLSTIAGLAFVSVTIGCPGPTVAPAAPLPPSGPRPSVSGTLPSPMDTGRTAFYDFMQQVQWAPPQRVQMCTGSFSCFFGAGKTPVDVQPSAGSYLVDPGHVDPKGVVILRAFNRGSHRTLHYSFRPGPYMYGFVVYPDQVHPDSARWILNETDTITHVTVIVPGEHGRYFPCGDKPAANTDYAGLFKCGEAHPVMPLVRTSDMGSFASLNKLLSLTMKSLLFGESPIWKSCPAGCCTLLSLN